MTRSTTHQKRANAVLAIAVSHTKSESKNQVTMHTLTCQDMITSKTWSPVLLVLTVRYCHKATDSPMPQTRELTFLCLQSRLVCQRSLSSWTRWTWLTKNGWAGSKKLCSRTSKRTASTKTLQSRVLPLRLLKVKRNTKDRYYGIGWRNGQLHSRASTWHGQTIHYATEDVFSIMGRGTVQLVVSSRVLLNLND